MKQYGLLAAVFGGTLAVLLVVFLVVESLGSGTATASPSPSASDIAVASQTPAASTSAAPSASVAASVEPSATPGASPTKSAATPRPTATPAKSIAPGDTITVVVLGSKYINPSIAPNATVTKLANGGIIMASDRSISDPSEVNYELPNGSIPAGTTVTGLDVAVCGVGNGDFWETYGPADADPTEDEATSPDADGCWHYLGGAGKDSSVKAIVEKSSQLRIDKVVYSIKTGA